MSKTKSRIQKTALQLFNDHGYSEVTIRKIALELNMSSGNLNYHFRKREEILEALYFEMVEVFDKRVDTLGEEPITLQSIKEDIQGSLERMIAYRFFWTDLFNILRSNEAINSHYQKAYNRRFQGYKQLFSYLLEEGLMRPFEFAKEEELLTDRMITISNTWLYNSFVYNEKIDGALVEDQTLKLFSMLYPYLTDLGKTAFRKVIPGHFE